MTRRIWAALLIVFGLGFFSGLIDRAFRALLLAQENIDLRQYATPHYDRLVAQEPVIGAILLVGGLILWFMPGNLPR
jgi:hypothetical protein